MNNILNNIQNYIPYNQQEEQDKKIIIDLIKTNKNLLNRDTLEYHITASSWIVNKKYNKVLMVYHNIYDSWSWTGGHADNDSDLLNVAIKEAKEETGIKDIKPLSTDIFSIEILSVDGHIKKDKYVNSHLHLNVTYLLCGNEDNELFIKEDENSNVKWFDIDEAINASSEKWFRDNIYSKLNKKFKEKFIGE